ncbi:hypothetical protein M9H77_27477 [Catharanthus roseus]|uniref:Uncharacterized protein n=1 Tax=Catharanthus roseus TaxID=4058 RepID=A0ACC0ADH3_CATRO|nr:hypothetical protein M9H77_27477 [Catharanthus roseus]
MARGRKREYVEDASTSQDQLLASTIPTLSTTLDTQPTSSSKPPTTSTPPTIQQLDLNVNQATSAITSIFHERFVGECYTWSQDRASILIKDMMRDIQKYGKWGPEKHTGGSISCTKSLAKKGIRRFYFRKVLGTGVSRRRVYESGLSCKELALIGPCYADMLRRVEAVISSISDAFDKYMRWFMEQNHLVYIPHLPMLDFVRAPMGIGASTSSPPASAADSEVSIPNVSVQSFLYSLSLYSCPQH